MELGCHTFKISEMWICFGDMEKKNRKGIDKRIGSDLPVRYCVRKRHGDDNHLLAC